MDISKTLRRLQDRFGRKADALLIKLELRLDRILQIWLLAAGLLVAVRTIASPYPWPIDVFQTFSSYFLLVSAPVVAALATRSWLDDAPQPQPSFRMARAGRWRTIDRAKAELHPLYGPSGIMISLLIGMMMNVPVRAAEYVTSMPPMPAGAPPWLSSLHLLMTIDAVLFTSLYMVAFVAALRCAPLFPRMLVAIWLGDIMMQLVIAQIIGASGPLPAEVRTSLLQLLDGNVKKVLISVALWLPYLLLSTRVNVTYRHRLAA